MNHYLRWVYRYLQHQLKPISRPKFPFAGNASGALLGSPCRADCKPTKIYKYVHVLPGGTSPIVHVILIWMKWTRQALSLTVTPSLEENESGEILIRVQLVSSTTFEEVGLRRGKIEILLGDILEIFELVLSKKVRWFTNKIRVFCPQQIIERKNEQHNEIALENAWSIPTFACQWHLAINLVE